MAMSAHHLVLICAILFVASAQAQTLNCGAYGTYNAATKACNCVPGWGGNTCNICQSDSVCASVLTNAADPVCVDDYAYKYAGEVKSYSCKATGIAAGVVQAGSLAATCNTANSTCQISFIAIQLPVLPITCQATHCLIGNSLTNITCSAISCVCQPSCTGLYGSLVTDLTGGAGLSCPTTGDCSITIAGVPIGSLTATCDAGACVDGTTDLAVAGGLSPALVPAPAPSSAASSSLLTQG